MSWHKITDISSCDPDPIAVFRSRTDAEWFALFHREALIEPTGCVLDVQALRDEIEGEWKETIDEMEGEIKALGKELASAESDRDAYLGERDRAQTLAADRYEKIQELEVEIERLRTELRKADKGDVP